jgi:hypothetical protein
MISKADNWPWFIFGVGDGKLERVANLYYHIMIFLTKFTLCLIGLSLTDANAIYFYAVNINQHSMVPPVHNWEVNSGDERHCGVHPPPKVYVVRK